ncbi:MAG: oxidoreductase [Nakamurella sp.]
MDWDDVLAAVEGDPEVIRATAEARESLADLHRHPANRRGWARSAAAGSIRAARASAAIEGVPADEFPEAEVRDPILAGALRATAEVAASVQVWERSPLQALARLHSVIAGGLQPAETLGRPVRAADRLTALAGRSLSGGRPAPVLVAMIHLELLSAQAFEAGNGVLARVVTRVAGIAGGLDPHGLGVPEVAFWRAGARYRAAGERLSVACASGDRDAVEAVVRTWLVDHSAWLTDGAREGRSIADVLVDAPG